MSRTQYTSAEGRTIAERVYRERGFRSRIGAGARPALVNVDLANAWTRPGSAFSCDGMDRVVTHVARLLSAARARAVPVVYTTVAYEAHLHDAEPWIRKIPALASLRMGSSLVAIDERIAPGPEDTVLVKKMASAFAGTPLATMLHALAVDTVIVTGVTASACVRHTVEDALFHGFRPLVVAEAVGDRIPAAVEYNLFDIDSKFGDVETAEMVLQYLEKLPLAEWAILSRGGAPSR
jgi:maleamate amidohydrolase